MQPTIGKHDARSGAWSALADRPGNDHHTAVDDRGTAIRSEDEQSLSWKTLKTLRTLGPCDDDEPTIDDERTAVSGGKHDHLTGGTVHARCSGWPRIASRALRAWEPHRALCSRFTLGPRSPSGPCRPRFALGASLTANEPRDGGSSEKRLHDDLLRSCAVLRRAARLQQA